jgi:hypothetical protein
VARQANGEHSGVRRFALRQIHLEAGTATGTVCTLHDTAMALGNRLDE